MNDKKKEKKKKVITKSKKRRRSFQSRNLHATQFIVLVLKIKTFFRIITWPNG